MGKVELSNVFKNLKMDNSNVDTTKAKEYLEEHKEFRSDVSFSAPESLTRDSYGNKVYCLPYKNLEYCYMSRLTPIKDELITTRSDGIKKLAKEIEKETELMCQLEYLIRRIPIRETKHSIRLILQHLEYLNEDILKGNEDVFVIKSNTPLLALGCWPHSFKMYEFSYLITTVETAVICSLFTELCQKSGLDCVKLGIGEEKTMLKSMLDVTTYRKLFNDFLPEVTGVITDKCDIDSAVETFICSEYHPFPLTRIYVQESAYKEFKDILNWKCKSQKNHNLALKSKCTDAFKYENKIFYLDYVGSAEIIADQNNQLIVVEAYRTVKELLSLLNKITKPLCLSLWASGVSEANEIALNVAVPVIWINDYNNFNGPNKVSQSIFDKMYSCADYECDEAVIKKSKQHQSTWAKLSFDERYEKVVKAFESASRVLKDLEIIIKAFESASCVLKDLEIIIKTKSKSYWKVNDFVEVSNQTMILGFNLPIPIVTLFWSDYVADCDLNSFKIAVVWLSIAKALINGSAFVYTISSPKHETVSDIFKILAQQGLPVFPIDPLESTNSKIKMDFSHVAQCAKTKVIWTNFGTRFAN